MGDLPLRTPIHRRFGGPLPRQLPNGTHAYPSADRSFNKYPHAGPLFHGALIHLSMGCAPLMGKLHTRYSPVRRSPPQCIATPVLPLDLHVLSLSLAFILSQDQTLRCFKLFLLISLAQDPFHCTFVSTVSSSSCTTGVIYVILSKIFAIKYHRFSFAGAKVDTISELTKCFEKKF